MQDTNAKGELRSVHDGEELPPTSSETTGPRNHEPAEQAQPTETRKGEPPVAETQYPQQPNGPQTQLRSSLPQRWLYYTTIAGVIAGVFTALLTIVITLVFAGTFHSASQQIAVDKLTVKTALALAALELLNFSLSLLIGFVVGLIVGRIAVRRRLGFLAGAIAGAVFYLITFLVSLISSYPGNLAVKATTVTTGSLVISLLLLCLWSIGGGLVSLFGTWVATVRHPHYVRLGEQQG